MKFVNIVDYDYKDTGTTFTEESQTRQSDYEDVNSMVQRIIRGEIIPHMPDEFEYDEKDSVEDILNAEHPLDAEDLDISDFGSLHQDDIREELEQLQSSQDIQQEQEQSGANTNSSSDVTVPVDNLENSNDTK